MFIIYNNFRVILHTPYLRSLIRIELTLLNLTADGFLKRTASRQLGSSQASSSVSIQKHQL